MTEHERDEAIVQIAETLAQIGMVVSLLIEIVGGVVDHIDDDELTINTMASLEMMRLELQS